MQSLHSNNNSNRENCLTCLLKLNAEQASAAHAMDLELRSLLLEHSDWQPEDLTAEWLPQQLCGACHQQLLGCAQFQRQARACRQQLLTMMAPEEEPAIFEIVYEQEAIDEQPQQLNELFGPPLPAQQPPDPIDEPAKYEEEQPQQQLSGFTTRRRCRGLKNSFKCAQCGHSFAHKHTLAAHVRKVHEGQKRAFQCDRCDKAYSFMGGLYTHIREIHEPKARSHRCDHPGCDRVYSSNISMQKHKRLKHFPPATPARKYVCEECGSTFNQTANLKHHRRTKHPTPDEVAANALNSEQHFCDKCQKHFHSRYTLKYHIMQQHADEAASTASGAGEAAGVATMHECQVCGRRLAKRFMLVQHMLMHSAEKLPCEHCGRPFARKFELEAHIRAVHLKLKPFACIYCDESFASRKTLRHHEYIHTGEKPYVCNVCGQAFRQQTCLKNHGRVHDKHK